LAASDPFPTTRGRANSSSAGHYKWRQGSACACLALFAALYVVGDVVFTVLHPTGDHHAVEFFVGYGGGVSVLASLYVLLLLLLLLLLLRPCAAASAVTATASTATNSLARPASLRYVVFRYMSNISHRMHPSPIIAWRAAINMVYGALLIVSMLEARLSTNPTCGYSGARLMSALVQYTTIAGEAWFTVLCVDLYWTLTNPFTSYRRNMRIYHYVVWSLALISAVLLNQFPVCQGRLMQGVCWIDA